MAVCAICKKSFSSKYSLKRHSNICGSSEAPPRVVCFSCGKTFARDDTFRLHWRRLHEGAEVPKNIICDSCGKAFYNKRQLLIHWNKYHEHRSEENLLLVRTSRNVPLKCAICHIEFASLEITGHYTNQHGINGLRDFEYLDFDSEDSFLEWKKSVEKATACLYIKAYSSTNTKVKYVCHRSGEYKTRSKGIRNLKTQGTKKINGFCPAHIYKQTVGRKILVRFLKTHVGHENELCHVQISRSEKLEIASRLAQKVPKRDILNNIRESYTGGELDRIHLLTIKDIANIRKQYKLEECRLDKKEGITVENIIEENKSSVLYYKAPNTVDPLNPFINEDNFVLILMDDAQTDVLKEFGNDIVAVDGTHGIGCDFTLHTIVILDEMRQGIPVASVISDQDDSEVLNLFFSTIKNKIGEKKKIEPAVLMSNLSDELYNAWEQIMGHPRRRLFCTWHVMDAWKEKLKEEIKDKEKISHTCRVLRTILEEPIENKCYTLIEKTLEDFANDELLKNFQKYFIEEYVPKIEFWAYSFRTYSEININMSVERIHQTIKYYYSQNNSSDRLSKFLYRFLFFSRDRVFDRILMKNKGKFSYKLRELRKRHSSSLTDEAQITAVQDNFVISSDNNVYYVTKNVDCCDCKLFCNSCEACIHQFVCTCVDSCIKWNMCKHIHSVCQYIKNGLSNDSSQDCSMLPMLPIDGNVICVSPLNVEEAASGSRSASPTAIDSIVAEDEYEEEIDIDSIAAEGEDEEENETGFTNEELTKIHMEVLEIIKTPEGRLKYASILWQAKGCISAYEGNSTTPEFNMNVKVKKRK